MIANWNKHLLFWGHIKNDIERNVLCTSVNGDCDS